MIKIIIVDDHQLIINGLRMILDGESDFNIIDADTNGTRILKRSSVVEADIALVDIDMPEMDGFQLSEKLKAKNPEIRIIILTMHKESELMKKMMEKGVQGYVLKNSDKETLVGGIREVAAGKKFFDSDMLLALMDEQKRKHDHQIGNLKNSVLSNREIEIITLIANGLTNKEIADKIFLSPATVDKHRTNIMAKLNIHNVAGLIRYAYQTGLITP